jgi:branched-chain amino acid aminotransferase
MTANTHTSLPDPRNRDVLIYVNGSYFRREDAKISVFDSAFLVGDGIWEGLRLHQGKFSHLDRHLNRLFTGLATARIDLGLDRQQLSALLHEVVDKNGMTDGAHVRLMISRGTKKTPSQHPDMVLKGPTIVIIAEYKIADQAVADRGISLFTSTVRRPPPDTLDQQLNCHSKLHEVLALLQAYEAGADEALMLDTTGAVATCNATNFFMVSIDGAVWTSTGQHCLNGVTRGLVLELCRDNGIACAERAFSLTQVYGAAECFVTGTFGGLTPVNTVDGRTIGTGTMGPVTQRLLGLYQRRIAGEAGLR